MINNNILFKCNILIHFDEKNTHQKYDDGHTVGTYVEQLCVHAISDLDRRCRRFDGFNGLAQPTTGRCYDRCRSRWSLAIDRSTVTGVSTAPSPTARCLIEQKLEREPVFAIVVVCFSRIKTL